MRYFKISEDQLRDFIESSNLLDALRAYGVDNWDGYEEAVNEDTEATEEDLSKFELVTFEPLVILGDSR